ncbi:MAG: hypothetical protein HUJ51_04435 [Eggerthellaceae bacterium]|nr:hypothetical protein [Eggerthellaceae bacterium]
MFNFDDCQSMLADPFKFNLIAGDMKEISASMLYTSTVSCDSSLKKFCYVDTSKLTSISIYSKDFPKKNDVIAALDKYNEQRRGQDHGYRVVQHCNYIAILMDRITTLTVAQSVALIVFVSISPVDTLVMNCVIFYISVLERRKEIGTFRIIGANKCNFSSVLKAESIIFGQADVLICILFTAVMIIPSNMNTKAITSIDNICQLPLSGSVTLQTIAVILTLATVLIPAFEAANSSSDDAHRF